MLLSPEDPLPYSIVNAGGCAPVLFVCDHGGRAFPSRLNQLGLDGWVLEQHVAWDIGSGYVARRVAKAFDATLVAANYSRLVVDTNRYPDDPTLCTAESDGIAIPGNIDLSDAERVERMEAIYHPYHAAIAQQLDRIRQRNVIPAIIAIHSCTRVFHEVVRPWHFGVLWDTDPRIALPLLQGLGALKGICVGDNEPYSGRDPHDYTMDHHGEAALIPHVSIEVRQDLVDSKESAREYADILNSVLKPILDDAELYCLLTAQDRMEVR